MSTKTNSEESNSPSLAVLTRRTALLTLAGATLTGCQTTDAESILGDIIRSGTGNGPANGLSTADYASGIRVALKNGVTSAVNYVGKTDGYLLNNLIHIPLPGFLGDLQSTLSKVGLSSTLDNLETQINRGAEKAAPLATDMFVSAITSMSVNDAVGIVRGSSNAATQYLQRKTGDQLVNLFTPTMTNALQRAGAIQSFDKLSQGISAYPFAGKLGADAKQDLITHGVTKGLDGIFYYIGQEEAAIRSNPAKRTSEILRKVFG